MKLRPSAAPTIACSRDSVGESITMSFSGARPIRSPCGGTGNRFSAYRTAAEGAPWTGCGGGVGRIDEGEPRCSAGAPSTEAAAGLGAGAFPAADASSVGISASSASAGSASASSSASPSTTPGPSTRSFVWPTTTTSPTFSACSSDGVSGVPLTLVPFADSRSSTTSPPSGAARTSAWRRDSSGSPTICPGPSASRPMRSESRTARRRPEPSPDSTTSHQVRSGLTVRCARRRRRPGPPSGRRSESRAAGASRRRRRPAAPSRRPGRRLCWAAGSRR